VYNETAQDVWGKQAEIDMEGRTDDEQEAAVLKDLVLKNRSYRRFHEEVEVDCQTLRELVDLARLSASASNKQPLRYMLACTKEKNALIFPTLAWADYLKDWNGPSVGERPSAYIIVLADNEISTTFSWDAGICSQSILLGATEKGLGGCIIGSVNKPSLKEALNIPDTYEIVFVLALGKPKEHVVIEPVPASGDIKYWRDAEETHHVPKRSLEDLIIG
jgi:nitroreductase